MKKSIKRMLTTALAIAMMVTMIAMPASAYPTDTKTFVLMNEDMSAIYNWMMKDITWGGLNGQENYDNGSQWGSPYGLTTDKKISYTGGVNILAGDWPVLSDKNESHFSRKIFVANPIKKKNDNLTFTYDITTGAHYTTDLRTIAFINSNADGPQLFGYDPSTLALGFGGVGDYTFDFPAERIVTLQPLTDYTVTITLAYDETAKCYDLIGNVKGGEGDTEIDITVTADNYSRAAKSDDFSSIGFRVWTHTTIAEETPVTVLTVKNIKIEETVTGDILNFGDVAYNNYGVQLDENMANVSVADLKITTPETEGYADGYIWAHSAGSNGQVADVAFTNDGTYFWAKSIVGSTKNFVSKKFDSMRDGSTLTFTGTYRTSKIGGGDAGAAIRLKNNDGSFVIDAIELSRAWNGYTVRSLGTNGNGSAWTDYDGTTFISANWNLDLKDTNYEGAYFNKDTDLSFTLTMQPNADDSTKYDVSVTTGVGGTKTATRQITAEQATSLTTVEILAFNNSSTEEGNFMGVKNINVTTTAAVQKDSLAVGENTVYLPVENVTGHAVDYAIVAAVYETGNDIPKDFAIATYAGHQKGADKLAINGVTISDTDTEYVVCYVFDKFDSLAPHTKPISSVDEDAE